MMFFPTPLLEELIRQARSKAEAAKEKKLEGKYKIAYDGERYYYAYGWSDGNWKPLRSSGHGFFCLGSVGERPLWFQSQHAAKVACQGHKRQLQKSREEREARESRRWEEIIDV